MHVKKAADTSPEAMERRVREASSELVRKIQQGPAFGGVMLPMGNGEYSYTELTTSTGPLLRSGGRGSTPPPGIILLDAMAALDTDRRAIFVPEIYSPVLGQTVRAAVILPKGYDPALAKQSAILTILPGEDGFSIAHMVQAQALDAIDKLTQGMFTTTIPIILIPELPLEKSAIQEALASDIVPYVEKAFGSRAWGPRKGCGLTYPGFNLTSASSLEVKGRKDPAAADNASHARSSSPQPSAYVGRLPSRPASLRDGLDSDPNAVLVSRYGEVVVENLDRRPRAATISITSGPPTGNDLEAIKGRASPLPIIARITSPPLKTTVDYAIILPPGFDPSRKTAYQVQTVLPPLSGASLNNLIREVLVSKPMPDTLRVIPDPAPEGARVASQRVLQDLIEGDVLGRIPDGYNVTLEGYSVLELSSDTAERRTALDENRATEVELPTIHVSSSAPSVSPPSTSSSAWRSILPVLGDSPSTSGVATTEIIPEALQRLPRERGGFFMPVIKSEALGKSVRAGVYLPPGYDPSSPERYPVLFLLPGRKNPLSSWLVAGSALAKLDRMMSGDAQKMIVVIADNTDSYFVNSPPKEMGYSSKTIIPRGFQDHLMKELLPYATESLKGDASRLSLGGVSRGAFGAFVAAAEYPGTFKGVASYSGLVGSERYAGKENDSPDEVDRDGPNPARLALEGAFSGEGNPRIHVEVGAEDEHVVQDATEFAAILRGKGARIDYQLFKSPRERIGHDWDLWGPRFEEWIGWHQSTFGQAGVPGHRLDASDISSGALAEFAATQAAKWKEEEGAIDIMLAMERALDEAVTGFERPEPGDLPPWIQLAEIDEISEFPTRAAQCVERAERVLDMKSEEPFSEVHGQKIRRAAEDLLGLDKHLASIKAQILFWTGLDPAHRAEFGTLFTRMPEAREAIISLLGQRPAFFAAEDSVNHKRFASQLIDHIDGGFVKPDEVSGFVQFLRRLADRTWTYREGGYSHSNCAAMMFPLNHPGVLLDMIEAARSGKDYPLFPGWKGFEDVGAKVLEPRPELKSPWQQGSVSTGSSFSSAFATSSDTFGYEKGFIRALKDSIAPRAIDNPKAWKAGRCDPIAFALSRIAGEDYRYGYAYTIETGSDLVEAMETQTGEGWIAMADVGLKLSTGRDFVSHFPVFYDYDPVSRTIAMQDFGNTFGDRIAVDGLTLKEPAIYYKDVPEIQRFLTPQHQKVAPSSTFADSRWNENADPLLDFGDTKTVFARGGESAEQLAERVMEGLAEWKDREVAIRIHHQPFDSDLTRRNSAIVEASSFKFPSEGKFELNHKTIFAFEVVRVELGDAEIARPKEPILDDFLPFGDGAVVLVRDKRQSASEPFRKEFSKALEAFGDGDVAVRVVQDRRPTVAGIVNAASLRNELKDFSFGINEHRIPALDCDRVEITRVEDAKKKPEGVTVEKADSTPRRANVQILLGRHFAPQSGNGPHASTWYEGLGSTMGMVALVSRLIRGSKSEAIEMARTIAKVLDLDLQRKYTRLGPMSQTEMAVLERHLVQSDLPLA